MFGCKCVGPSEAGWPQNAARPCSGSKPSVSPTIDNYWNIFPTQTLTHGEKNDDKIV